MVVVVEAFVPHFSSSHPSCTQLSFGIPSFWTPQTNSDDNNNKNEPKEKKTEKSPSKIGKEVSEKKKNIGLAGIVQLLAAGAGAPFLGEFERVEEGTGKLLFTLEANNLVDENGNSKQTQMPYFENGWVDPEDLNRAEQGFQFPWQKK